MIHRNTGENRLRIHWFESCHPDIDSALKELPEMNGWPHELYRMLLQDPGGTQKRIALITQRETPVAVAAFRKRRDHWIPVTHYILPGAIFPVQKGYLGSLLVEFKINVWIAWWRMSHPPPLFRCVRWEERESTHKLSLRGDFENFWRTTSHFNTVKRMRKRCRDFHFKINFPGSAEWTIRNWERKYRENPESERPDLHDKLLAAKYLEERKRHFTFILFDQEKPIAGETFIVHRNDLVSQHNYRDPEYKWYGIGVRLMDIAFHWAAEAGFEKMDIGGGFDEYKGRWAPMDGEKYTYNICPGHLHALRRVNQYWRAARARLTFLS